MKGSKKILKGLVLLLSLSLAGCFVAYRAKAFEKRNLSSSDSTQSADGPISIMPSSKSIELPSRSTQDQQGSSENPASNSGGALSRASSPQDSPVKVLPPDPNDRFIGSSKSDKIFEPENTGNQPNQSSNTPVIVKQPEHFMGSSKSGGIFRPIPAVETTTPKDSVTKPVYDDDDFMGSSKSAPIFRPKPDTNKPKQVPNNPPK